MRRSDREITDRNEMIDVMRRCDACRLAFNAERTKSCCLSVKGRKENA